MSVKAKRIKTESFKNGDLVILKSPIQGRSFDGRVLKNNGNTLVVGLPNGLYAELPIELWTHKGNKEDEANDVLI